MTAARPREPGPRTARTARTSRFRLARTVRMRLTVLYGALFLAAGTVLLAATYLLVAHSLPRGNALGAGATTSPSSWVGLTSSSPSQSQSSPSPSSAPSPSAPGSVSPSAPGSAALSPAPEPSGTGAEPTVTADGGSSATNAPSPSAEPSGSAAAKLIAYCLDQQQETGNPSSAPSTRAGPTTPAGQKSGRGKPETLQDCVTAFTAGSQSGIADQRDRALSRLLHYSLAGLAAMTVLSGVLGWIVAGRVLRPVAVITSAARRASHRHLGERLAMTGPRDELTSLADAFDDMLDRLDRAFAGQRRFVADASHELRTPLAVMRTAIDVTLAKPARTKEQLEAMAVEVRDAADRAEELIEALLTLARSERGVEEPEPADLATAAEDRLDAAAPQIRAAGLDVTSTLDAAPCLGNPVLLERLVSNLVDNAVRHNVPGGRIRIRTGREEGGVFVAVENDGVVVPEDAVPGLFEPFRRLEQRTGSGTGVGLSIVAAVTAAHGGRVTARARPAASGGGLALHVHLPPSPAPAVPPRSG